MKLEVKTAKSTQTAIPELNKESKTLNYLIIGEGDDKVILNVGEKTVESINKLLKPEAPKKQ